MAGEDRIQIQIVLDDGSVIKGFQKIEAESKKAGKNVEDNFASRIFGDIKGRADNAAGIFSGLSGKITIAFAAAAAAAFAFKKALDFAVQGEKINSLNKQFEILTKNEGVATQTLRSGLESASAGLISTEDLIQVANKAVISLGDSASRLPEVLELSVKAASVLGKDAKETFQELTRAIETGNKKTLQNLGITLDTDKVYRQLARSVGVTVAELTTAQKQQALLNAVLDRGKAAFSGIDAEINPLQNSIQRFSVASGRLFDDFVLKVNGAFGPGFVNLINKATEALNDLTSPSGLDDRIKRTEQAIASLNEEIALTNSETIIGLDGTNQQAAVLEKLNAQLAEQKENLQLLKFERQSQFDNEVRLTAQELAIKEAAEQREKEINARRAKEEEQRKQRLQVIQNGINQIFAQGAVKLGESLTQGGNAFDNFARGITGIIADQIITLGQALIIQGLAIEKFVAAINSLLPGSGLAAAGAGLGLVLFGTALKAAVGAGGKSSSAPAGGLAGGGLTVPDVPISQPVEDIERQEPKTSINVNISGDVLDSDETGLRIVNIIQREFDQRGSTVVGFA